MRPTPLAAALAVALAASPAAAAEPACAPVRQLTEDYLRIWGEVPVAAGVLTDTRSSELSEVLATFMLLLSEDGGWTALTVSRAGEACVLAHGVGFAWIEPPPQLEPLAAPAAEW